MFLEKSGLRARHSTPVFVELTIGEDRCYGCERFRCFVFISLNESRDSINELRFVYFKTTDSSDAVAENFLADDCWY